MGPTIRLMMGVLLLALAACSSPPRGNIAYNPTTFGTPDAPTVQKAVAPYRLNALDKFHVTVYRVAELSRDYQVEPTGTVNFPLVGEVNVLGMTSIELQSMLTKRYGERYLQNPSVSVQIDQMTANVVTVEGSVKTPQVFGQVGESNLLEAIARAGGPDEYANQKRVVVFRTIDGQRKAAAFDLQRVREGLDANPTIFGGDTIIVDGSNSKRAVRQALSAIPLLGTFVAVF